MTERSAANVNKWQFTSNNILFCFIRTPIGRGIYFFSANHEHIISRLHGRLKKINHHQLLEMIVALRPAIFLRTGAFVFTRPHLPPQWAGTLWAGTNVSCYISDSRGEMKDGGYLSFVTVRLSREADVAGSWCNGTDDGMTVLIRPQCNGRSFTCRSWWNYKRVDASRYQQAVIYHLTMKYVHIN